MPPPTSTAAAAHATSVANIKTGRAGEHARLGSHDDPLVDEDGDDVFSNPDTAELESRSDATGATSPAPNSPGPGSPTNRPFSHIAVVASSPNDPYATLKNSDGNVASSASSAGAGGQQGKPLSLPQTNIAHLQQQLEQQQARLETPRGTITSVATPVRQSPRPTFGRALSASGATMQTMSSSMHATHSASGSRIGPSTPRLGGHASSHSASHLSLPHSQLPSAHGLPSDPREASTLSKLFAHPPAQSPAEEFPGFIFAAGDAHRPGVSNGASMSPSSTQSIASPSMSGLAARRLSRPATRPSSPDRLTSTNRKFANRASGGAMGLGLSPQIDSSVTAESPMVDNEASIFERDIEHRNATHVLSKQEAMDVAIPSVLDDAVEAIHGENADQLEIVAPHAAPPPLALSAQALSAHSNSQIKLQQVAQRSPASSPHHSPSPPLSNAGAVERPPGSMAAQIAERLSGGARATPTATMISNEDALASASPSRHRRPNSDVSISSASSMRSRSPQAPLTVGVQQVLAASNTSPRSATGTQSIATMRTDQAPANASPASGTPRATLPTATALPGLPLPNPYRSHSPSTTITPLPESGLPMLPSVSMDGAVMPSSESATLDASFGSLADVIASQPPTSANSLANSPSMRLRGLALDDHGFETSPYTSRSPIMASTTAASGTAPNSRLAGRGAKPSNKPLDNKSEDHGAHPTISNKKRLSFFSYADIINQTPAELLNFGEAVRQAEDATNKNTPTAPASPSATNPSTMTQSIDGGTNKLSTSIK